MPGDLIHLQEGDQLPADVRLLSVTSFAVEEAILTGKEEEEEEEEEEKIHPPTHPPYPPICVFIHLPTYLPTYPLNP